MLNGPLPELVQMQVTVRAGRGASGGAAESLAPFQGRGGGSRIAAFRKPVATFWIDTLGRCEASAFSESRFPPFGPML